MTDGRGTTADPWVGSTHPDFWRLVEGAMDPTSRKSVIELMAQPAHRDFRLWLCGRQSVVFRAVKRLGPAKMLVVDLNFRYEGQDARGANLYGGGDVAAAVHRPARHDVDLTGGASAWREVVRSSTAAVDHATMLAMLAGGVWAVETTAKLVIPDALRAEAELTQPGEG